MERKFVEAITDERGNDFTHQAVAPEFFTEPIAELCNMSMDILLEAQANAANGRTADFDAKILGRLLSD
jgi:hypothetical protein